MRAALFVLLALFAGPAGADGSAAPSQRSAPEQPSAAEIRAIDRSIASHVAAIAKRSFYHDPADEPREYRIYRIGPRWNRYDPPAQADKAAELVWVQYAVEVGNSYGFYLAAFDRRSMKRLAYGRIGGKGSRNVQLEAASDGYADVRTLYYRGDPMCCPSLPGRSSFSVDNGMLYEGSIEIDCEAAKAATSGEN